MFSTLLQTEIIVLAMLKFSSANASNLDQSKILSYGKELNESWKMLLSEPSMSLTFFGASLTLFQRTNFKLFQTESLCKRQF